MRKFFRGICGVLATLLTLCILLMAAGLMGVRAFGITPYVVPADMEGLPWSAGALLYVRQEQPETLQPGDTIAYVTDSDLSLEGGVIGSVDTERRFFYVEGAPVYWDNVLGQPLWGIDGLGYVSGYISRPPGLYLVLGAAVVLALLCIFPLRRRKGKKTEGSPTGRAAADLWQAGRGGGPSRRQAPSALMESSKRRTEGRGFVRKSSPFGFVVSRNLDL